MSEPKVTLQLALAHGLTADEYDRVIQLLGREPNYTELGIFSALWSEHCSYKSSRKVLAEFPTTGPRVLQGPGENAGVVEIGDGLACVFKIESHNHPSFIEPFQGAATGVGGIIRDIFTMGARPLCLLDPLRFGSLTDARNRYLMGGVVSGISWYGNCIGIPTVGGEVMVAEEYSGNPLVNVLCVGLVETEKIFRARADGIGNPVIYVGSKTGRDGIHGATMASEVFEEGSEERRPTVQVGDPFTEKLLLEACLEAMATGAVVGIQDMGAAGLACCTSEMPGRAGTGMEIDLSLVPQREAGMIPYEIMLSESQERMLLVARSGEEERLRKIFARWELDAVVIGRVTEDGMLRVMSRGERVAEIPVKALTDEAPVYDRPAQRPAWQDSLLSFDPLTLPEPADYSDALLGLLGSPAIASKEWVYRQYDQMVGINTIVCPGSDAAVLRVKGTRKALAVATDGNGRQCYIDPRQGGAMAVAEAARNVVCSGARPVALTDCLNFGNPERPEIFWQFREAVAGMAEACRAFGTPVVGGNVSFYNETQGQAILPTPVVGMVGLLEDADRATTQWVKAEGDLLLLLGPLLGSLGGSEYLRFFHNRQAGRLAPLNLEVEEAVQAACLEAIEGGLVRSAHDASDGGLAVCLAEACVSGPVSFAATIELPGLARPDLLLFGEGPSRILLSVGPDEVDAVEEIARRHGVPVAIVGRVEGRRLTIRVTGRGVLVDCSVNALNRAWRQSLEARLG